jgi:hypothetical protein
MNIQIGPTEKTLIRIQQIKALYKPGMSALDIANALSAVTREHVTRMVVMGIYNRNRDELSVFPLRQLGELKREPSQDRERRERENVAKRERRRLFRLQREAERAAEPPAPVKERKPAEPALIQTYDATALLKRLFELGAKECRWPISGTKADILFCGHKAEGIYCHHHRLRSVGKGTISEQRAPNDLRRHAA